MESSDAAPEGKLCYIKATDVFNLPAQEMTDEEMLQIIDFQHKMAYAVANGPQAKAAGGITEDEAIEIARKAMVEDIGDKAKGLKLVAAEERYGWKAYLWDITDWEEYNAKGGELGWSIQFNNVDDIENEDDLFSYDCMVDAMDGSICGANTRQGFIDGETVWYEH